MLLPSASDCYSMDLIMHVSIDTDHCNLVVSITLTIAHHLESIQTHLCSRWMIRCPAAAQSFPTLRSSITDRLTATPWPH